VKLSTKGRYASRLMLELALNYGRGPMQLKDIAEKQDISEKYLGHLVPALKTAGLINANRGAHGGYSLTKSPRKISLKDVVLAAEGNLDLVECLKSPESCSRVAICVTRDIWGDLTKKMINILDLTSLEDMVRKYRKKQSLQPLVYSI